MLGTVRKIDAEKGYGFIKTADGGKDYFFHRSALKNCRFEELVEGQEVTFEHGEGQKGPRAEDIYA